MVVKMVVRPIVKTKQRGLTRVQPVHHYGRPPSKGPRLSWDVMARWGPSMYLLGMETPSSRGAWSHCCIGPSPSTSARRARRSRTGAVGKGPFGIRLGMHVKFNVTDVPAWIDEHASWFRGGVATGGDLSWLGAQRQSGRSARSASRRRRVLERAASGGSVITTASSAASARADRSWRPSCARPVDFGSSRRRFGETIGL